MSPQSELEMQFESLWITLYPDLPAPVREHRAIPGRRFRFDFAWPEQRVAVELQGGLWVKGRHVRGAGYERDCEKLALAQRLGWRVFYLTRGMLESDPLLWFGIVAEAVSDEGV